MSAPSAVNIHGTADAANDILDEPNGSPVLDVEEFKFKVTREKRERKNNYGNVRRIEYFNPIVAISLTAWTIGASGLATQHPGTRVTSLSNFAVEKRGMDPTQGSMILEDTEETLSLEEDQKTVMNIIHAPFVIPA